MDTTQEIFGAALRFVGFGTVGVILVVVFAMVVGAIAVPNKIQSSAHSSPLSADKKSVLKLDANSSGIPYLVMPIAVGSIMGAILALMVNPQTTNPIIGTWECKSVLAGGIKKGVVVFTESSMYCSGMKFDVAYEEEGEGVIVKDSVGGTIWHFFDSDTIFSEAFDIKTQCTRAE